MGNKFVQKWICPKIEKWFFEWLQKDEIKRKKWDDVILK